MLLHRCAVLPAWWPLPLLLCLSLPVGQPPCRQPTAPSLAASLAPPQTALGWADDPTGSTDRNPAFARGAGARLAVTLGECALACEAARPNCDAFTYNSGLLSCFLKTAQCPLRNNCQVGGWADKRGSSSGGGASSHMHARPALAGRLPWR